MDFNDYKNILSKGIRDERFFVLGLDFGAGSSQLAYFDLMRSGPVIIDVSGGYGSSAAPTALEYAGGGEWLFGEYADSGDRTFTNIKDALGTSSFAQIDGKPKTYAEIAAIYLKELIGCAHNINPKAQIAGIVAASPANASEAWHKDLKKALNLAGYGGAFIGAADERECALTRFLQDQVPDGPVMLADLGTESLRVGIYEIADSVAECLFYEESEELALKRLHALADEAIAKLFAKGSGAAKPDKRTAAQLAAFCRSHRALLLGIGADKKPVKLYFNFAYPAFAASVSQSDAMATYAPYEKKLATFLRKITKTNAVSSCLLTGSGFDHPFTRALFSESFRDADLTVFKTPKSAIAEGAAIISAVNLGASSATVFSIKDSNRLQMDYGVMIRQGSSDRFYPLAKKGALWSDDFAEISFILNERSSPAPIVAFYRRESGGVTKIAESKLSGFPQRPAKTTRLSVGISFDSPESLRFTIKDVGFGELYPSSGLSFRATAAAD